MATLYSDIDLNFTSHPATGDLVKKLDEASIIQSLKTLCLSSEEEILNEPLIGGNTYELLFNLADGLIQHKIKSKIEELVKLYETRIELKQVEVERLPDEQGIAVNIVFYFANRKDPISETFFLRRLR